MQHRALRSNLFAAAVLFQRCFFLSTDTDVGGSKQKRVLLSKTCYQTCTRMYRFDNRSKKPHLHYTRGKKDFHCNRCPGDYLPYFYLFPTYGRNSFCGKRHKLLLFIFLKYISSSNVNFAFHENSITSVNFTATRHHTLKNNHSFQNSKLYENFFHKNPFHSRKSYSSNITSGQSLLYSLNDLSNHSSLNL